MIQCNAGLGKINDSVYYIKKVADEKFCLQ
jgi:hypothetical protein